MSDPEVATEHTIQVARAEGQRKINILWETTQAVIAVSVCLTTLGVAAGLILHGDGSSGAFLLLSNVFFLVVGTYFQRTNHTKVGGVGGDRANYTRY